ncbi:hypothetical protein GH733_014388 [Mirounga leonina]|nr:hypothetical protein GH733_014388 [Mirounga leonina]
MFQSDSTHGKFSGSVKAETRKLVINRKLISIFQEKDPAKIKWDDPGGEYAVESTDVFTNLEKARAHLKGGRKRVISASSSDTPMFGMGMNPEKYDNSLEIVRNFFCTTKCLAFWAKVIRDNFDMVEGLMATVHAITGWPLMVPLRSCTFSKVHCTQSQTNKQKQTKSLGIT